MSEVGCDRIRQDFRDGQHYRSPEHPDINPLTQQDVVQTTLAGDVGIISRECGRIFRLAL